MIEPLFRQTVLSRIAGARSGPRPIFSWCDRSLLRLHARVVHFPAGAALDLLRDRVRPKRDDHRQLAPAETVPAFPAARFEREPADNGGLSDEPRCGRSRFETAHDFFLLKKARSAARIPPPIATATLGACEVFGF